MTRLLTFGDPRASSDMPPFVRARRFLEHLCTLDSESWNAVLQLECMDCDARDRAEILVRDSYISVAERVGCEALVTESRRVVRRASSTGLIPETAAPRAVRLVANAALALVLRDLLPDAEFRVLYGSFVLP